jgi:hypothetical protein
MDQGEPDISSFVTVSIEILYQFLGPKFLATPIPLIPIPILGVCCCRLQKPQYHYGFVSFTMMFLNETFDLSSCACSPI